MKILNSAINIDHFFEKVSMGSVLMLDYDGTLAPFVKDRMQAVPYVGVKERLLILLGLKTTRLVIVSGRSLSDLDTLLAIPNLELWGSHGLERKLPDGTILYTSVDQSLHEGLEQAIQVCKANKVLQHCETKPFAIALHERGMEPFEKLQVIPKIEPLWKKICSAYELEIHHFDCGLELRPKAHTKGDVVHTLLNEISDNTAVAFLGDDITDEEAFAALANRGLKVLVREQLRPTLADIYLIPPHELLTFLDRWINS